MCSPLSSGIFVPATEACTGHDAETAASWPMQVAHISIRSAAYLMDDCLARTRILGEHISAFKSGNITQVPRVVAVGNQQQSGAEKCGQRPAERQTARSAGSRPASRLQDSHAEAPP